MGWQQGDKLCTLPFHYYGKNDYFWISSNQFQYSQVPLTPLHLSTQCILSKLPRVLKFINRKIPIYTNNKKKKSYWQKKGNKKELLLGMNATESALVMRWDCVNKISVKRTDYTWYKFIYILFFWVNWMHPKMSGIKKKLMKKSSGRYLPVLCWDQLSWYLEIAFSF